MNLFTSFLAGLVFGIGLIVSGMANPAKVLGFLDLAGAWEKVPKPVKYAVPAVLVVLLGLAYRSGSGSGLDTGHAAAQLKQPDFNIDIIVKEAKKIPAFATVTSLIDAMTIFVKQIERPANQEVEIDKRLKIVETLLV